MRRCTSNMSVRVTPVRSYIGFLFKKKKRNPPSLFLELERPMRYVFYHVNCFAVCRVGESYF